MTDMIWIWISKNPSILFYKEWFLVGSLIMGGTQFDTPHVWSKNPKAVVLLYEAYDQSLHMFEELLKLFSPDLLCSWWSIVFAVYSSSQVWNNLCELLTVDNQLTIASIPCPIIWLSQMKVKLQAVLKYGIWMESLLWTFYRS